MARTTVDDCLEQCPNHFELAYRASRRARDIMNRGDPRVPEHGDKSVVIALREIADPNALAEPAPPDAEMQADEHGEAVVFGAAADPSIPPSPDEPDPADPMGERAAAPMADSGDESGDESPPPASPDEPDPEHLG